MPRKPVAGQMLSESAYDALKWRILNLELPVGRLFSVAELCELVGLGRAPVSHAVLRLQEERLIDVLPRRGIMIKAWSAEGFAQIRTVREPLERLSARLATLNATPTDVQELRGIIARETQFLAALDRRELRNCDTELHCALARISGNEILLEEVAYLHQLSASAWYTHVSGEDAFKRSHAQHSALVSAIAKGDPDAAERAMGDHMSFIGGGGAQRSHSAHASTPAVKGAKAATKAPLKTPRKTARA